MTYFVHIGNNELLIPQDGSVGPFECVLNTMLNNFDVESA
jgi:hypothetical protein